MFFMTQCAEEDSMAFADEEGSLQVKLLSDKATLPSKANRFDAGFDLYASESVSIDPESRELIGTDIAVAIPNGHVGLIWPRSGLAVKQGIDVFAGVIDAEYRGEVKVCLYNSSNDIVELLEGDRIAQLLIQKVDNFFIRKVLELDDTDRGSGGFGSSGR
jgi:dUTP pyrophosphatase